MRRLCFEETVEKVMYMLYDSKNKYTGFILNTCTGLIGFELINKKISSIDLMPEVELWFDEAVNRRSSFVVNNIKSINDINYYVGLYKCKNPAIMRVQVINAISICIIKYALGHYQDRQLTSMITYAYLSTQQYNDKNNSSSILTEFEFLKEFTNIFSTRETRNNIFTYLEIIDYTNRHISEEITRYVIGNANRNNINIPNELFNNLYSKILFIGLYWYEKYSIDYFRYNKYNITNFLKKIKSTSPKNRIDLIKKVFN